MQVRVIRWALAVVLAGCGSAPPPQAPPPGPSTGESGTSAPERKALTREECEAQGGGVVGDIGDGATQRPEYVCPSGKRPLGNIAPPPGGPIAVEGSVCCPR